MSRKIYMFQGHPPIPGTVEPSKANGALGRKKLRAKKRARKLGRRTNTPA